MIKKFSPKKIRGGWNKIPFLGYMDSSFVEIEYDEDAVTPHVGAQGDVTFILNANQMAKATITLIQGSPTNEALSKLTPDPSRDFMPTGAFALVDLNGTTIVSGDKAVIQKSAKVEFSKTLTGRKWTFLIPQAQINVGAGGD